MRRRLWGAVSASLFMFTSIMSTQTVAAWVAVPISGQGTWETTLEGRLETAHGSGVFMAYYDTVLDITWAANANINGQMDWDTANAWAAGLNLGGVSGWRLPTVRPVDGSTFNTSFSNDATTDRGYAPTTTNGTDGGWRDINNTPVSEMGHMYYVTLGNFGFCAPDDPLFCVDPQPDFSFRVNTGPFFDVQFYAYWSDTELSSINALEFFFNGGVQDFDQKVFEDYAWAVRSGDVPAVVPVPAAVWLFSTGLIGLLGIGFRNRRHLMIR